MLSFERARRVFVVVGVTDMRKSFNGLSGIVRTELGEDPVGGDLFLFCNRLRNRLKVLYHDGSGLWVLAKRLERGTFRWPMTASDGRHIRIRREELALLLGGLDAIELKDRGWKRRA